MLWLKLAAWLRKTHDLLLRMLLNTRRPWHKLRVRAGPLEWYRLRWWHDSGPDRGLAAAAGPDRTLGRVSLADGRTRSAKRNILNVMTPVKLRWIWVRPLWYQNIWHLCWKWRSVPPKTYRTTSLSNDLPTPKHPTLRQSPSLRPPGDAPGLPDTFLHNIQNLPFKIIMFITNNW